MQALKGTDKQVSWATDIRAEKMATISAMIDKGNAQIETLSGEAKNKAQQARDQVLARVKKLQSIDSATYWIDARHDSMQMLMASVAK